MLRGTRDSGYILCQVMSGLYNGKPYGKHWETTSEYNKNVFCQPYPHWTENAIGEHTLYREGMRFDELLSILRSAALLASYIMSVRQVILVANMRRLLGCLCNCLLPSSKQAFLCTGCLSFVRAYEHPILIPEIDRCQHLI